MFQNIGHEVRPVCSSLRHSLLDHLLSKRKVFLPLLRDLFGDERYQKLVKYWEVAGCREICYNLEVCEQRLYPRVQCGILKAPE